MKCDNGEDRRIPGIQILEYPIPPRPSVHVRPSQKPPSADIWETDSGIIYPLVSKRPEKIQKKIRFLSSL